jgi:hypothetical protein
MVVVRGGTFSIALVESSSLEDLLRCLVFMVDAIDVVVLDARVLCHEAPLYSVKINCRGYSDRVVESLCRFALRHVDGSTIEVDAF